MTDLFLAATMWHNNFVAILPVAADGSKRPAVPWKKYQTELPTDEEAEGWFGAHPQYTGLGVVCGEVSGNLEMYEFEGRAVAEGLTHKMMDAMVDHDQRELWSTLLGGYAELTPTNGVHIYYRVQGKARGNTKLARRPATEEELALNPAERFKVLIETRGEGGYSVVAPTPGTHHASGKPWTVLVGSPATIPTITAEQRDMLYAISNLFDEMPVSAPAESMPAPALSDEGGGVRPGDDYNAKTQWEEILVGWKRMWRLGTGYAWRRPGKEDPGISATTGQRDDADRLYVFTTSTEFESLKPYTKFSAYALLEHGGDFKAAAKALAAKGYGEKPKSAADWVSSKSAPPSGPSSQPSSASSSEPGEQPTADQAPPAAKVKPPLPLPNPRYTDNGNAMALIEAHGEHVRYCVDIGRWLTWDGVTWRQQPPGGGYARELAKQVALSLDMTDDAAKKWQKSALSAIGITNALIQAATDPRITIPLSALNADPWVLGTPAGIIDLRTGVLSPPDPAKLLTRSTKVEVDMDADMTVWQKFLDTTFGKDTELIEYLQRLVGYSATGHIGPHILPFAYGSGGNGKGVFLESTTGVLGDYSTTAPNGFLMAHNYSAHETEIARLAGARMVLCSEVNETDKFDEAKVKDLTGGDTLTARFMRQDHFTFSPTHHLWLMGNYRPAVTSGGRSFWRRCRLIPFTHEVPKDVEVDDLQGSLIAEHGPAILAWIVKGAVQYANGGLKEPASVVQATADYAHDQDTVGRFVEEMCHTALAQSTVRVTTHDLCAAYLSWCIDTGETAVTAKRLGKELRDRFSVGDDRSNGKRFYTGITLIAERPEERSGTRSEGEGWYR